MFKKNTISRTIMALALGAILVGQPVLLGKAFAAPGDFTTVDLTAAAPLTYDHATGGGAYDQRDVGRALDIVESLEGGDFVCGDFATFLTRITVKQGAFNGAQTVLLSYKWLADSTGQSGIALDEFHNVGVNYLANFNGEIGGEGSGGADLGNNDNGNSVASIISQDLSAPLFQKGATRTGSIQVTNLEPGESVILRFDLQLQCNGQSPTGNLQVALTKAEVTAPTTPSNQTGVITGGGNQTVPFRHVGDVCKDPKDCPPPK
jgi:hypothetical protein